MAELITKDQVIDWFRCYGHMDKPIPYDVLVTDIQAMDAVGAANLQQNDNCAAIAQQWISVTERLPEQGERVLATDGGFVGELYVNSRGQWKRYNVNDHSLLMALDILWWMPMPKPPMEVPENETL